MILTKLYVGVGVNSTFLGAIFKSKGGSDFLVTFYVNKHNPKKFFDFVHFWRFAPQKTVKTRKTSKNPQNISFFITECNILITFPSN